MEEITRKFSASSQNKNSINIIEYTTLIDITTVADKERKYRHGLKRYATNDRKTLNKVNGGYQLLGENEIYFEE
jgi:hypothetical protein